MVLIILLLKNKHRRHIVEGWALLEKLLENILDLSLYKFDTVQKCIKFKYTAVNLIIRRKHLHLIGEYKSYMEANFLYNIDDLLNNNQSKLEHQ